MNRRFSPLLCMSLFLFGCGLSSSRQAEGTTEVYIPDANSVGFDISPAPKSDGSAWIGTYKSQGKTALFRFEFEAPQNADHPIPNMSITMGKGRFVALEGSDSSSLLIELKKALEAKQLPTKVARVKELPFSYASFGDHQSQAREGGGFGPIPPGNWNPRKIFIGEDKGECEFFLNINPAIRKGQFSIKDPDYGDQVLAQLAKVL